MAILSGRSELATTPADGDLIHVVDISDTTDNAAGTSKKVTVANLLAAVTGATLNADTSLVGNGYFLDEDNMASDDDTKVASQQSIKAYVDANSGDTVTNNYSSIGAPQLFNPDASGVSGGTDDFTVSSSNDIAIVTVNGQVLDDSEYSLAASVATVVPDNGFDSTSDEVLIFQHTYAMSTTGLILGYAAKTANYTALATDYLIDCTSNSFTITLLAAATLGAGKQYTIKNSGTGTITIDGNGSETIDGDTTKELVSQYDSVTIVSNGANWIII